MRCLLKVLFFVVLVFGALSNLFAEDFSADMVSSTTSGNFNGKIFASQDKVRMEAAGSVIIARMDKQVTWILMPDRKVYMEQPLRPTDMVATGGKVPGETSREFLGDETVGGKLTKKYKIGYNVNGKDGSVLAWIMANSEVPVKMQATDGSWSMEYNNLIIGAQPDSLFQVPADYQKLSVDLPSVPSGVNPQDIGD